ncbi:unnamed protein product [Merluccius merluccius]
MSGCGWLLLAAVLGPVLVPVPVLGGSLTSDPPCLIISEVNADNPKLDTTEFVELYHTAGRRAALDGYTLVFYNGNGNVAYKVLDLRGHTTDERGFFLVGSVDLRPKPSIPLPPNTVQNGPDAVALYRSAAARYAEKMNATAAGLVDAVVYMTRRTGGAEVLAEVLTPGQRAFQEDEASHAGDESIERCLLSGDAWTFGLAPPSPGQRNRCVQPTPGQPLISELNLAGGQADGWVELAGVWGSGPLVLVVMDAAGGVTTSIDVEITGDAMVTITIEKSFMKGDEAGAVALYGGRAVDFPPGGGLSPSQPTDAFVFWGRGGGPGQNLTETLIPGRPPYRLSPSLREGGVYLSRCGVAPGPRDPGVFWEAPQTPSQPNSCPWPRTCPQSPGRSPSLSTPPPHLPPWGRGDFVINELNADSPGAAEDGEYIELWHPSGRRVALAGLWLLLFTANANRPYREVSLSGHFTTARGYFLLGSDRLVPAPSLRLPPNTIQNGPDAVALYRSPDGPPSVLQRGAVPTAGLLDAVVYRLKGSDKEARALSDALTPGQLPLLEDASVLPGDEGLSRCGGLHPADLSAFTVAPPTPLRENACPRPPPPPEGVVVNEVSVPRWTNQSQQQGAFVELVGPPLTPLKGLVLLALGDEDRGAAILALPLTGSTDANGFYLVGNAAGAGNHDNLMPSPGASLITLCVKPSAERCTRGSQKGTTVPVRGGVGSLCHDVFSVCRAAAAAAAGGLRDAVAFSQQPALLLRLGAAAGEQVLPEAR